MHKTVPSTHAIERGPIVHMHEIVPLAHENQGEPIVPDMHKPMPLACGFKVATPMRKWTTLWGE